jgi:hypothetical protein
LYQFTNFTFAKSETVKKENEETAHQQATNDGTATTNKPVGMSGNLWLAVFSILFLRL